MIRRGILKACLSGREVLEEAGIDCWGGAFDLTACSRRMARPLALLERERDELLERERGLRLPLRRARLFAARTGLRREAELLRERSARRRVGLVPAAGRGGRGGGARRLTRPYSSSSSASYAGG